MNEDQRFIASLQAIISWYRENRRMLPWRENPTPYHVWISEIMLQQTRIETVIPYYNRFIREIPDVAALAAVDEDTLLKLWEGLGYYSRARNLKKAAVKIMAEFNGRVPESAGALRLLPGIGEYTAGAIASIACGRSEPAVDGNVMRVITRLTADASDVSDAGTRRSISGRLRSFYPTGEDAALLTEGLMELGEVLCLPNGMPRCEECPLQALCLAHLGEEELSFPVKSAGRARRTEEKTVLLLKCGQNYAIRKRPKNGLLAGLWEFPNYEGFLSDTQALLRAEEAHCRPLEARPLRPAKHIFTHVEWLLTGYEIRCACEGEGFVWASPEEILARYSIPSAFRAYQKLMK